MKWKCICRDDEGARVWENLPLLWLPAWVACSVLTLLLAFAVRLFPFHIFSLFFHHFCQRCLRVSSTMCFISVFMEFLCALRHLKCVKNA